MDLNHIALKPLMLADLYGKQLIETELSVTPDMDTLLPYIPEPIAPALAPFNPESNTTTDAIAPSVSSIPTSFPVANPAPVELPDKRKPAPVPATSAPAPPDIAPPVLSLPMLGKNQKKIVVLVNHTDAPILPDSELNFLTNVLAACKLSLADIAIVNYHNAHADQLKELLDTGARQVLLFDVTPLTIGLPINFPHFQVQPFSQRTYLHAPALGAVEKDKGLKMQLWNGLKQLFAL